MSDVFLNKFYESALKKSNYFNKRIHEIKGEKLKSSINKNKYHKTIIEKFSKKYVPEIMTVGVQGTETNKSQRNFFNSVQTSLSKTSPKKSFKNYKPRFKTKEFFKLNEYTEEESIDILGIKDKTKYLKISTRGLTHSAKFPLFEKKSDINLIQLKDKKTGGLSEATTQNDTKPEQAKSSKEVNNNYRICSAFTEGTLSERIQTNSSIDDKYSVLRHFDRQMTKNLNNQYIKGSLQKLKSEYINDEVNGGMLSARLEEGEVMLIRENENIGQGQFGSSNSNVRPKSSFAGVSPTKDANIRPLSGRNEVYSHSILDENFKNKFAKCFELNKNFFLGNNPSIISSKLTSIFAGCEIPIKKGIYINKNN